MILPLLPLAAPAVTPLYRVRYSVAVPLAEETSLADARSDGSAVGMTSSRMVNSVIQRAIYVVRARSYDPDVMDSNSGGGPGWNPVALLGGSRVAVTRSEAAARPPLYVATLGRGLKVGRTPIARRPVPAPRLAFGNDGSPRAFPTAWRTPRLRPGGAARPLTVRYTRLPSGTTLGTASVDTGPGDAYPSSAESFATIRRGRVESLLRNVVAGRPDLGEILWVSPQGWIVAAAYRGEQSRLVWLEPIRR